MNATTTPTAALVPGARITWGSGSLPGVYNGPTDLPGEVSIKLDMDGCSIRVLATTVEPVTATAEKDICPNCGGYFPADEDFCEGCEFGDLPA